MQNIELIVNTDMQRTSHLFCEDCVSELNVLLDSSQIYRNPRWTSDWDAKWHKFHTVRFIFPTMLMQLLSLDGLPILTCPYCSYKGAIVPMEGGLFDIKLIQNSLDADNSDEYKCAHCEKIYASQKCVARTGRHYICGDCAAFA
jgi:hypothetical protein